MRKKKKTKKGGEVQRLEKKKKKKRCFFCKSQKLANVCSMIKRQSDTKDPTRARPQHTCKSLDNFPRSTPNPTNTNGIYTTPSPGTTISCCSGILRETQLPPLALATSPVLCQPLDKAVYCKLHVSMTLTMEPSDKAVYCKL